MSQPAAPSDDGLSDRLEGLFSSYKGPPRVEPRQPGSPPAPADLPDLTDDTILQALDVAGLVRYLEGQLAEVRRETAEGLAAVLAAVQAMGERVQGIEHEAGAARRTATDVGDRLEEFGQALFDWFEAFSQWQTGRFDSLDRHMSQLLAVPPRRPTDPPA